MSSKTLYLGISHVSCGLWLRLLEALAESIPVSAADAHRVLEELCSLSRAQ